MEVRKVSPHRISLQGKPLFLLYQIHTSLARGKERKLSSRGKARQGKGKKKKKVEDWRKGKQRITRVHVACQKALTRLCHTSNPCNSPTRDPCPLLLPLPSSSLLNPPNDHSRFPFLIPQTEQSLTPYVILATFPSLTPMEPNDEDRSEIAFFDVETTVPTQPGQGFAILEFGSILVCPRKLVELRSYSTLIRPSDLSLISTLSVRCNGITRDAVVRGPCFSEVADEVYDLLHGRIWAGHNIVRFDCKRIQEAFAEIGRPAPEPKGTIDSLALLTQKFGRRAGDMKMASLATYFGLGKQTHRSLDDVRMNLEVLKYCSTVLFLESSLPDIFTEKSWVSPNATTRSRSNGKTSPPNGVSSINTSVSVQMNGNDKSPANQMVGESHPILSLLTSTTEDTAAEVASRFEHADSFDMASLTTEIKTEQLQADVAMEDKLVSPDAVSEGCSGYAGFLDPEEMSIPSISACLVSVYRGIQRIRLLHSGMAFHLCSTRLKVRFGISTKYLDATGRPRLSFVVDATQALCQVLDNCDHLAEKLSIESGSSSEWRHVVSWKNGFMCSPTLRLHIPTVNADGPRYETEMYREESSGKLEKLVFSHCDAAEVATLLKPGTLLDAYVSLDHYDYQQNAGIRLVAKKLVIHC